MDDDRDSDDGAAAPPEGRPRPRRFDAASPSEVTKLEATFGLDIDGDGRVGDASAAADVPDRDTSDVHVRRARPDVAPTTDDGGSPFVDERRAARRWWPALLGLAIGIAIAYWYFGA